MGTTSKTGKKERWTITWDYVNVSRMGSGERGVSFEDEATALARALSMQEREAINGCNARMAVSHYIGVKSETPADVKVIEPFPQADFELLKLKGEVLDAQAIQESLTMPLFNVERVPVSYGQDCQVCPWKEGVKRDRTVNLVRFITGRGGNWGWGMTYCDEHLKALTEQLQAVLGAGAGTKS